MTDTTRRLFLRSLAFGAGGLAASQSLAAGNDGHASGYDVAPASDYLATIPRRTGDPVTFTASLDSAPIKATSGGWAREITMRSLPIATGMAVAHLFLNPGGSREMHWHNSAEWAYIVDGHCQVTIVDPEGLAEIVNLAPGDLWFFPKGHSHAIQTLGSTPCHAILAFDDGLYSEHGTFGISDCKSRVTRKCSLKHSALLLGPSPKFRRRKPTSCRAKCLPWTAPKRVPLMSWTTRERIAIASWHRSQG